MPATEAKYGEITTTGKQLYPGEPVFLLRGTDPLAPAAIRNYAVHCSFAGCDREHVAAVNAIADRIEEWQKASPDLVKKLPD